MIVALGDYVKIECMACIGGTDVADDVRRLESGVHCVVGTPGRVFDMINRRALQVNEIRQFVLDEADEMLSSGLKDKVYDIIRLLPAERQVGRTVRPHTVDLLVLLLRISFPMRFFSDVLVHISDRLMK
jgi:translation initiation factor 4A